MAAISITANSCIPTGTFSKILGQLGETVTAGQVLYQKSSDGKFWKAQCDGTAEESGSGVQMGIALAGGVANQYIGVLTGGTCTTGGTHTKGFDVYLHSTAGSMTETIADIVSTNYKTNLGIATTTAIVNFSFNATGLQLA